MANKGIEIPFGAYDSELGGFEYTIPEGYKAEIKDGKVVVKKTESEDERIRENIIATIHLYYGEPFAIWFKEPVNIKFVHQLQQALRLCGISKEIEL